VSHYDVQGTGFKDSLMASGHGSIIKCRSHCHGNGDEEMNEGW
jgi:hypothetical protein